MSITISKIVESIELTTLSTPYGEIEIKKELNEKEANKFTTFDTIDEYEIYINEDANELVAIPINQIVDEDVTNQVNVFTIINNIKDSYPEIETISWAESDASIIIKGNNEILNNIKETYEDTPGLSPTLITPNVLFLEVVDSTIKLEDDNSLIDKLDDNSIKSVSTKVGMKLSGSETKDELKGILKGKLSNDK